MLQPLRCSRAVWSKRRHRYQQLQHRPPLDLESESQWHMHIVEMAKTLQQHGEIECDALRIVVLDAVREIVCASSPFEVRSTSNVRKIAGVRRYSC